MGCDGPVKGGRGDQDWRSDTFRVAKKRPGMGRCSTRCLCPRRAITRKKKVDLERFTISRRRRIFHSARPRNALLHGRHGKLNASKIRPVKLSNISRLGLCPSIGGGRWPWRLAELRAYFADITKATTSRGRRDAYYRLNWSEPSRNSEPGNRLRSGESRSMTETAQKPQ